METNILQKLCLIGLVILMIITIIFVFLCPLIIFVLITNYLFLNGIYWWAVIFIMYILFIGIIVKLIS